MTANITTRFWGMVINNYDETDLALIRNGYANHVSEFAFTLEKGENGTPHIQAFMKLQRQQRLSFVKKLFPRGNFKALLHDEYVLNMKNYAQKLDETAESPAVQVYHDPIPSVDKMVHDVAERMLDILGDEFYGKTYKIYDDTRLRVEHELVVQDFRLAKFFVSQSYVSMWKKYGESILLSVSNKRDTHTHTHTDEEQSVDIETYQDADSVREDD